MVTINELIQTYGKKQAKDISKSLNGSTCNYTQTTGEVNMYEWDVERASRGYKEKDNYNKRFFYIIKSKKTNMPIRHALNYSDGNGKILFYSFVITETMEQAEKYIGSFKNDYYIDKLYLKTEKLKPIRKGVKYAN